MSSRALDARLAPSNERHMVRGACPLDCPDTCSWDVTVEGNRAVGLRGTRDHPFTRGSLCAKVDKYLDVMYSPDRLMYPFHRVGRKGEGRFERCSWDEALSEIAARPQPTIRDLGGAPVSPCRQEGRGKIRTLLLGRGPLGDCRPPEPHDSRLRRRRDLAVSRLRKHGIPAGDRRHRSTAV